MSYLYAAQMIIPGYPFYPVKIGFSETPEVRKRAYSYAPFKVNWVGVWEGTRQDETEAHQRFAKYRLSGEWFVPTEEVVDFITASIGMGLLASSIDALVEEHRVGREARHETIDRILFQPQAAQA